MVDILYQDDHILAVHKPTNMLSVTGNNPEDGISLIDHLTKDFPDARIVHRLDQATSGVMILALGLEPLRHLSRQFEKRQTSKTYIAKVYGAVDQDEGTITEPLICDWPNRPLQKICYETGKPCETHWRVLSRDSNTSVLELTPITGRSHQLRVHCDFLGHPILGDEFYAHKAALDMSDRLELYAVSLTIHHPHTNQEMIIKCPEDKCPNGRTS